MAQLPTGAGRWLTAAQSGQSLVKAGTTSVLSAKVTSNWLTDTCISVKEAAENQKIPAWNTSLEPRH